MVSALHLPTGQTPGSHPGAAQSAGNQSGGAQSAGKQSAGNPSAGRHSASQHSTATGQAPPTEAGPPPPPSRRLTSVRSYLMLLAAGVLLPMALLAGIMTLRTMDAERSRLEQSVLSAAETQRALV